MSGTKTERASMTRSRTLHSERIKIGGVKRGKHREKAGKKEREREKERARLLHRSDSSGEFIGQRVGGPKASCVGKRREFLRMIVSPRTITAWSGNGGWRVALSTRYDDDAADSSGIGSRGQCIPFRSETKTALGGRGEGGEGMYIYRGISFHIDTGNQTRGMKWKTE